MIGRPIDSETETFSYLSEGETGTRRSTDIQTGDRQLDKQISVRPLCPLVLLCDWLSSCLLFACLFSVAPLCSILKTWPPPLEKKSTPGFASGGLTQLTNQSALD